MSSTGDKPTGLESAAAAAEITSPQALAGVERARRSEFRRSWNRFVRYRPALFGLVFVAILVVVGLIPGVLAPYTATEFPTTRGASPSWDHPFGADEIGRDLLSRMIYGTRVALAVALTATLISITIGVSIGAMAGYFGGWVDSVLSRVVDALMAFPLLVLLLGLVTVVGPSLTTIVIVIGIAVWAPYARVVRADVLSLREREFIIAAQAIGARTPRIIIRHMIPNVLAPVIVIASLSVGSVIILESALSFLGFGIQPPNPSWGGILSEGRRHMRNFPHITIIPGVAITLTVLAFNLIGDGLRDALDPHQRE
jgi:peptide/nickel transport system permease protein